MPRAHETVGSNPATLTDVMRWVLCWYGKATVNRPDAGSIPAAAAFAAEPPVEKWKGSKVEESVDRPKAVLGLFDLATFRLLDFPRALGRSAQAPAFQAGQAGSIPAGHSARAGMG